MRWVVRGVSERMGEEHETLLAAVCKNYDGEADEYAVAAADTGRVAA